jgi:signal transduction histidine kinase
MSQRRAANPWWSSLRFRLAALGFGAIYVPVLLLLGVTVVTEDIEETTGGTGGQPAEALVTENGAAPWPWVPATALALGPVAAAVAWWWAGRAVEPLERIRSVAEEIEAGDLDRRIGLAAGPSEVVSLAASFDAMLARLSDAAELQHRLIEETSHELRTPLAVLSTNADVLLAHPQATVEVYREGLQRSKDTARRLSTIIDELLVDARGRARTVDRRPADLVEIARAALDASRPLAAAREVGLDLDAPGELPCRLDRPSIERAITNLVDNAVRHAPPGTTVEVTVGAAGTVATVAVSDHGPGIAAEHQANVFDRFWRVGDADAGAGLGLAIAKQIAEAHGGRLELASPGPGGDGCHFELHVTR